MTGSRKLAMIRKGACCAYCGEKLTAPQEHITGRQLPTDATWDHVIPRCKGGAGLPGNRVLVCRRCNLSKGGSMPTLSPTMFLIGCLVAARMEAR